MVDNFSIGLFLNGNNIFTGNNTFNGTTTFNGPTIINDGGSLNGTFSGNPTFSGTVTFSGSVIMSQLTLSVATGTPPLVVASTTVVPNLNVELVNGTLFPTGGAMFSVPVVNNTSPEGVAYRVVPDCFSTIQALGYNHSTQLFSCTSVAPEPPNCVAPSALHFNTSSNVWSCDASPFTFTASAAGCTTGSTANDVCTTTVTWSTAFADTSYVAVCSGATTTSGAPVIQSVTNYTTTTADAVTIAETNAGAHFTTINCIGVHN